jgi:large subunit ribosomal protein L6
MSRIGKLPISIPETIKVSLNNNEVILESGIVKKNYKVSLGINIEYKDKQIKLTAKEKNNTNVSAQIGMDRSNLKNIVQGMQTPFKIILEINGVGYKASVDKGVLFMTLGYSHEICYTLPVGVEASFEKPNLITISGSDKVLVGQVASEVISFRPPEPYKGKGVKVFGKKILRKEGKKK